MKKYLIGTTMALSAISGTALATNGANLVGIGVQSRALGGTGTAEYFGAESLLNNPALMGKEESAQLDFVGTFMMPDVKATTNVGGSLESGTSKSDLFAIPEINFVGRVNENITMGFGINGTSGIGVDYRFNPGTHPNAPVKGGLFNAYSNLQVMRITGAVAYNEENFGVGFAPMLQHGTYGVSYSLPTANGLQSVGHGDSTDLGFGFLLGGYYDINDQVTVGASYQSKIKMTYDHQNSVAARNFGPGVDSAQGGVFDDKMDQPAEWRFGVSFKEGPWGFTADYKRVEWNKVNGYKYLDWQNQDIIGVGVKYSGDNYWVGVGYSRTDDPLEVQGGNSFQNHAVDLMNNHFFPAIMKDHYTFGGGYDITKSVSIQGAFIYADKVTKTVDTTAISSGFAQAAGMPAGTVVPSHHTVEHSQTAVSMGLKIRF